MRVRDEEYEREWSEPGAGRQQVLTHLFGRRFVREETGLGAGARACV